MEEMNKDEMVKELIDDYVNMQRVKNAIDREKEIDFQLTVLKAKLQAAGIPTEDLEMK